MFKRMGALATIPVVLGLVASLTLAGTVFAAPWASVASNRSAISTIVSAPKASSIQT